MYLHTCDSRAKFNTALKLLICHKAQSSQKCPDGVSSAKYPHLLPLKGARALQSMDLIDGHSGGGNSGKKFDCMHIDQRQDKKL